MIALDVELLGIGQKQSLPAVGQTSTRHNKFAMRP
jgi:hypothetical protein